MNNNILMSVRREIWEHRALWITPLVVAGVLLLVSAFGGVNMSGHGGFWIGTHDGAQVDHSSITPPPAIHQLIVSGLIVSLTVVQLLALGVVVFFYLLDCLLAERRDKSILFWKSLPLSDGQVVASKALTALVVAPLFVLVVSSVMALLSMAILSLRMSDLPFHAWSFPAWLDVQGVLLGFVPMIVLWYLPIAGYLMVVSVWVRKNAFLWAILPPAGLLAIEEIVMSSHNVANFLGDRLGGYLDVVNPADLRHLDQHTPDNVVGAAYGLMGQVFADWRIWVSALCGLALMYAAIRIRRYRDES
jgi:ABC-2 type transport system permease protein